MKILFPCHELEGLKKVDDHYMEEQHAAKLQQHDCYLFDFDKYVRGSLSTNIPEVEGEVPLILRSQQLTVPQYEEMYDLLKGMGYVLINTPEQYKNCHHFPESYDYTKEYTSKSIFIKEWDADILQNISDFFGDKSFLMKDFVKSAKGYKDNILFEMPSGISGQELLDRAEQFVDYRGSDFSTGLVFKEFVDLKKYGDNVNEWRIFYYENRMISCSQNSGVKPEGCNSPNPDFFKDVAFQIDSNFFTIDVAEKSDGSWMIIETGDGQVSGLSDNQSCLDFYAVMQGQLKS